MAANAFATRKRGTDLVNDTAISEDHTLQQHSMQLTGRSSFAQSLNGDIAAIEDAMAKPRDMPQVRF